MSRSWKTGLGAAVLALLAAMTAAPALRGQDKPAATRRDFMRQKLEFSKQVLEGLTVENYQAITRGASALRRLSQAAQWEVPTIPNATDYVAFTGEFQRLCDELQTKAKERNVDGATLVYLRLTMNCVNCHKYVRFAAR
jgi:hypothetical protein